jgi:hypothetical protein
VLWIRRSANGRIRRKKRAGVESRPFADFQIVLSQLRHEGGFQDGALGNLSDTSPSGVAGDDGNGDTRADRTLTIAEDQSARLTPTTSGTHAVSFPETQFEVIALSPFDATPDGHYELAVCPASATRAATAPTTPST